MCSSTFWLRVEFPLFFRPTGQKGRFGVCLPATTPKRTPCAFCGTSAPIPIHTPPWSPRGMVYQGSMVLPGVQCGQLVSVLQARGRLEVAMRSTCAHGRLFVTIAGTLCPYPKSPLTRSRPCCWKRRPGLRGMRYALVGGL